MLSNEILNQITNGEINSRRKLYSKVGRTKALRLWLDREHILMPTTWNKDKVAVRLRDLFEATGRIPRAQDDWGLARLAQNHFGSWNNAIFEVFGEFNQKRYSHFTSEELLEILRKYIVENEKIPPREVFDGKKYPYFEAYFSRFNKRNWSQVIGMVDLTGVNYHAEKHGWGKKFVHNGVVYLSHQEYLIGKFLTGKGIAFEKEVPYGNSRHVFDFFLPDLNVYIEYYGIRTDDYKDRIEEKRSFYGDRKVIEIFKHDNTIAKLAAEVQRL